MDFMESQKCYGLFEVGWRRCDVVLQPNRCEAWFALPHLILSRRRPCAMGFILFQKRRGLRPGEATGSRRSRSCQRHNRILPALPALEVVRHDFLSVCNLLLYCFFVNCSSFEPGRFREGPPLAGICQASRYLAEDK